MDRRGSDPRRPLRLCQQFAAHYPGCWEAVDQLRAGRGTDLPEWPEWCFLPITGAIAIVSGGRFPVGLGQVADADALAALAAWRITQGVYRFDPALMAALWAQPGDGDLPIEVLLHLPEWCVYIPTPDTVWAGTVLRGFFAHLEWDPRWHTRELRLLFDLADGLHPFPIVLDARSPGGVAVPLATHRFRWPLTGVEAAVDALFTEQEVPCSSDDRQFLATALQGMVNCVLYLCAANREITDAQQHPYIPRRPTPISTRRGPVTPAALDPQFWQVGWRVGAALQTATTPTAPGAGSGHHARPRPHIRRAHWHLFWTGPRTGPRVPRVRWIPPTMVRGATPDTVVPVVHPVPDP